MSVEEAVRERLADLGQALADFAPETRVYRVGRVEAVGDGIARVKGLPEAAVGELLSFSDGTIGLAFNLDADEGKDVLIQAGAFAEHAFVDVRPSGDSPSATPVDGSAFQIRLGPGAQANLQIRMRRFVNRPTYDFPWDRAEG